MNDIKGCNLSVIADKELINYWHYWLYYIFTELSFSDKLRPALSLGSSVLSLFQLQLGQHLITKKA